MALKNSICVLIIIGLLVLTNAAEGQCFISGHFPLNGEQIFCALLVIRVNPKSDLQGKNLQYTVSNWIFIFYLQCFVKRRTAFEIGRM